VIGDSNQINKWSMVYKVVAQKRGLKGVDSVPRKRTVPNLPAIMESDSTNLAYLEGGGMEIDITAKVLAFGEPGSKQNPVASAETLFTNKINGVVVQPAPNVKELSGRKYSLFEMRRSGRTDGLVEVMLERGGNPWTNCHSKAHASPPNVILFHAGSHNCGMSHVEAREAVRQITRKFKAWGNPRKCLVIFIRGPTHPIRGDTLS